MHGFSVLAVARTPAYSDSSARNAVGSRSGSTVPVMVGVVLFGFTSTGVLLSPPFMMSEVSLKVMDAITPNSAAPKMTVRMIVRIFLRRRLLFCGVCSSLITP